MELRFGGRSFRPDIRYMGDLKKVLLYPESVKDDVPAYYMYRDLYYSLRDREIIKENDLRYDITVIPPAVAGKEYVKTHGHYHPVAERGLSFPEIYEVLSGKAIFLIQREEDGIVRDVFAISAEAGDKVIIPPDFGHVTINPSIKVLKMSNWVSRKFASIYDPYISRRGACYYLTLEGWVDNGNYLQVPDLKEIKAPAISKYGIKRSEEMYALIKNPEKLNFLNYPSEHIDMFARIYDIEY